MEQKQGSLAAETTTGVEPSERPVLVTGAARSGTTLVYHILLSSGVFPVYRAEPRIPECALRYPPLSTARGKREFKRAFLQSFQFERSGLESTAFEELVVGSSSYEELMVGFGDELARRQGKKRWSLKIHPYFARRVLNLLPEGRLVHVIRDGRDASVSRLHLGWGTPGWIRNRKLGLVWCAKYWEWQVRTVRDRLFDSPRYYEVHYEDLVRSPEATLRSLGRFTGCDLSTKRLKENPVGSLERPNSSFDARSQAVLSSGSVGRWAESLSEEEQWVLEGAIGGLLEELGYSRQPDTSSRARSLVWSLLATAASHHVHGIKWWLKENTFLRRLGTTPLEPTT